MYGVVSLDRQGYMPGVENSWPASREPFGPPFSKIEAKHMGCVPVQTVVPVSLDLPETPLAKHRAMVSSERTTLHWIKHTLATVFRALS